MIDGKSLLYLYRKEIIQWFNLCDSGYDSLTSRAKSIIISGNLKSFNKKGEEYANKKS